MAIVPTEAHASIHNPNNISFLEHIAKNVGIRAARGEYILVTNPYLYNNKEKRKKAHPQKRRDTCGAWRVYSGHEPLFI